MLNKETNRKLVMKTFTHSQNTKYVSMIIENLLQKGLNLQHSTIVTIYQAIYYKNKCILLMEYVEPDWIPLN